MDQTIEWLKCSNNQQYFVKLYGGVCVYVLSVWLSKGFVKSDTWIWLVEAQESEVGEL